MGWLASASRARARRRVSAPTTPPLVRPAEAANPAGIDWTRIGAALSAATSALGLALGLALTLLKFLSECRCSATLLNGCHDTLARISPDLQGMFDCTAAFSSPYSAILGVPLTAYAAALYAATLALSLAAGRRGSTATAYVAWLFALAAADVAASCVFFAVSWWILDAWCLLCFCMYFVSASLLAGATLTLRSQPRGTLARANFRPHLGAHLALFAATVVAAQAAPYAGACELRAASCRRPVPPPPSTDLRLDGEAAGDDVDPPLELAVIFDPSCSACAREFTALIQRVADDPGLRVRFLHFPRESTRCGLAVADFTAMTSATNAHACELSFLVECVARRPGAAAGDGLLALGRVFASRGIAPATARLHAIAEPFLSVSYSEADLQHCMFRREGPIAEEIAAHMDYAARLAVISTPTLLLAPVVGGVAQWDQTELLVGGGDERLSTAIRRARASTRRP